MRRRRSAPDAARAGAAIARRLCHQILRGEGVARAEVGVIYGDDGLLRRLNRDYRGLDRTTDVLSFTYEDLPDGDGRCLSGEVILSLPRLVEQASRRRALWGDELARLLAHGFLHLCGHDHKKVEERKRMQARERIHLRSVSSLDRRRLSALVEDWVRLLET